MSNNELSAVVVDLEEPVGIAGNGIQALNPVIVLAVGIGVGVLIA